MPLPLHDRAGLPLPAGAFLGHVYPQDGVVGYEMPVIELFRRLLGR